tara:strand:- start:186 stop:425 length:240 start_codon:yes stop_codon:yes gene_type:complete
MDRLEFVKGKIKEIDEQIGLKNWNLQDTQTNIRVNGDNNLGRKRAYKTEEYRLKRSLENLRRLKKYYLTQEAELTNADP